MHRSWEGSYVLNLSEVACQFHAVWLGPSVQNTAIVWCSVLLNQGPSWQLSNCCFIIRCHIILLQLFHTSIYSLQTDSKIKLVWGSVKIMHSKEAMKNVWKNVNQLFTPLFPEAVEWSHTGCINTKSTQIIHISLGILLRRMENT